MGGFTNDELAAIFDEWNSGDLESFLVEITAKVLRKKDDLGEGFLVDKILDKTGMKGACVVSSAAVLPPLNASGAAPSNCNWWQARVVGPFRRLPSARWQPAPCPPRWTSDTCLG